MDTGKHSSIKVISFSVCILRPFTIHGKHITINTEDFVSIKMSSLHKKDVGKILHTAATGAAPLGLRWYLLPIGANTWPEETLFIILQVNENIPIPSYFKAPGFSSAFELFQ